MVKLIIYGLVGIVIININTLLKSLWTVKLVIFTFDFVDNLNATIEEFESKPTETVQSNILVTTSQLQEVKQELNTLKEQFNDILSTLIQFGSECIVKKLKNHLPPRRLQQSKPNYEDQRDGINRSSLAKHFGFNTVKDLEDAASLFDIDPIEYLEELSAWQYHPTGENNPSPKFKPINSSN